MSQTSIELLIELTQADAIPGHEEEVRQIFQSHLEDIGDIQKDRLGSIFCTNSGNAEKPRILLDSHMDEVGFIVQSVTGAGYVKFLTVGGWWAHTLLAQRVNILTKQSKVPGVIGSTPPHLLSAGSRDKVMDLKDLYIDIGAESAEQAMEEYGVKPGCPIVPYGPFIPMKNPKLFSAKAQLTPEKTTIAVVASLAHHNMLRTKSSESYTPVGFIDTETNYGVIEGTWREYNAPNLAALEHMRYGRTSLADKNVRQKLSEYFNGLGQAPWQWGILVN